MTQTVQKGGTRARVNIVVNRADGTVENWGRMVHASRAAALLYALSHPVTMINRLRWRLKQWHRLSRTPA
jgi:hypothetical protein